MDELADVVVYGRISECLPALVEGLPALDRLTGRYFFSVVPPPARLGLRRGLRANHQMLAMVPSVTAAAATGLTTLRAPLFGMGRPNRLTGEADADTGAGWSGMRNVTSPAARSRRPAPGCARPPTPVS